MGDLSFVLPDGWKWARLGELGEISGGGTPSTKVPEYWDGDIPWVVPSEVSRSEALYISTTDRKITEKGLADSASRLQPVGTVMMTSRATIGDVVINAVPIATNQGFINIVGDDSLVFNEFLAYWIKRNIQIFIDRAHGVTFKEITKSNFKPIPICLPPLSEQRSIAQALRTVQRAKDARHRELTLERERKAALMEHLFTHGTRGEPRKQTEIGEMPESWRMVDLGRVADITYGAQAAVAHALDKSIGTPILTNVNITNEGELDVSLLRYYKVPESKRARLILKKGDLLFNWRSGSQYHVGKTALFGLDEEYTYSSFILRFRPRELIYNHFLLYHLYRIKAHGFFTQNRQQSSVNSVFNASVAATIPVVLPPLDEQHFIANALRACDAKIATLEREAQVLEALFRAMLDELMTGRLSTVPLL
jgi:type I restriction enzyme S subunit